MQVTRINFSNTQRAYPQRHNYKTSFSKSDCDTVSFGDVKASKEKAKTVQEERVSLLPASAFDVNLKGFHKDIDLFKGLSEKEVGMFLKEHKMLLVAVERGCRNLCDHCYTNAQPEITRSTFEDYKKITDGFGELSKVFGQYNFGRSYEYSALFYDSDCSDIYLKDKQGKIHEFPELNKMMYDKTHLKGLFDTSGWNPKDIKTQERMERFVKYYSTLGHYGTVDINISINPFHRIYTRSLELEQEGKAEKAKQLREYYIDRMANAMFTFTPLLKNIEFGIIARSFANNDMPQNPHYNGMRQKDFEQLIKEIMIKLEQKYDEDMARPRPKYVKNRQEKTDYLKDYNTMLKQISNNIAPTGRKDKLNNYLREVTIPWLNEENFDKICQKTDLMIDLNGKVHFLTISQHLDTNVQLNIGNKSKTTPEIYPPITKHLDIEAEWQ